jgi:hypothetical protein
MSTGVSACVLMVPDLGPLPAALQKRASEAALKRIFSFHHLFD